MNDDRAGPERVWGDRKNVHHERIGERDRHTINFQGVDLDSLVSRKCIKHLDGKPLAFSR